MKIKIHVLLLLSLCGTWGSRLYAQEYSSSFNVLRLPTSTHAAALGGQNVSLIEDSPSVGWANPALYANVSDNSFGLDFMTYASGSSWMGAQYVKAFGERHTMAVQAQYMSYGEMDETDEYGNVMGSFCPKDIVIGGGYSYLLSDRWSGGANLKFIFSNLAGYNAMAFAVDVGLNYYDQDRDFSVSATLQNMGTQFKAYDDGLRTHLPFTLALGFTKGMEHLPVRFHATLTDVTRWKSSYYVEPDGEDKSIGFGRKALNHLVLGVDVLPTDYLYLSVGYNFRRAYELKAAGSSHLAGFSAGGGLHIKKFQFGISYAKYHQAGNSLMFSAGYHL